MPIAPSNPEEEYFTKIEVERKKKFAAEHNEKVDQAEKQRLKELHHMRCPKCGMHLVVINYKNIEIDECSACKGIWLDESELDQIISLEKGKLNRLLTIFKSN